MVPTASLCECRSRTPSSRSPRRPGESSPRPSPSSCWPAIRELPPGTKVPSERELTKELGVGRSTVREALNGLAMLGIVEIRHGQGVFVTGEPAQVERAVGDRRRARARRHERVHRGAPDRRGRGGAAGRAPAHRRRPGAAVGRAGRAGGAAARRPRRARRRRRVVQRAARRGRAQRGAERDDPVVRRADGRARPARLPASRASASGTCRSTAASSRPSATATPSARPG